MMGYGSCCCSLVGARALLRTNAILSVHLRLPGCQVAPLALAVPAPGNSTCLQRPDASSACSCCYGDAVRLRSTAWSLDPARTAMQTVVAGVAFGIVAANSLLALARSPVAGRHDHLGHRHRHHPRRRPRKAGRDRTHGRHRLAQGLVGNPNYFGMLRTTMLWLAVRLLRGPEDCFVGLTSSPLGDIGLALGALDHGVAWIDARRGRRCCCACRDGPATGRAKPACLKCGGGRGDRGGGNLAHRASTKHCPRGERRKGRCRGVAGPWGRR